MKKIELSVGDVKINIKFTPSKSTKYTISLSTHGKKEFLVLLSKILLAFGKGKLREEDISKILEKISNAIK